MGAGADTPCLTALHSPGAKDFGIKAILSRFQISNQADGEGSVNKSLTNRPQALIPYQSLLW
jgi:hypothetical protein